MWTYIKNAASNLFDRGTDWLKEKGSNLLNKVTGGAFGSHDDEDKSPGDSKNNSGNFLTKLLGTDDDDATGNVNPFVAVIKALGQALMMLGKVLVAIFDVVTGNFSDALEQGKEILDIGLGSAGNVARSIARPLCSFTPHSIQEKVHGWLAPPMAATMITEAAQRNGADPTSLLAIAKMESNWDPNAASGASSAKGWFQFLDRTNQQFGVTNPFDPQQVADAGAKLWVKIHDALKSFLGREPKTAEVYLANMHGVSGAENLLSASQKDMSAADALAQAGLKSSLIPKAIMNNMTAQEKKEYPDWKTVPSSFIVQSVEKRYNNIEQQVAAANSSVLHGGPPVNSATDSSAQTASARAAPQPKPHGYHSLKDPNLDSVQTPATDHSGIVAKLEDRLAKAAHNLVESLDN